MEKNDNNFKEAAKKAVEKVATEKAIIKAKASVKEYRVKEGLGFTKRNYHIGGVTVLLEVGKTVSKDIVDKFHAKYQELYFEQI